MDEIVRSMKALQLSQEHSIATPANWPQNRAVPDKRGHPTTEFDGGVFLMPSVSDETAEKCFPKCLTCKVPSNKPYLRLVKLKEDTQPSKRKVLIKALLPKPWVLPEGHQEKPMTPKLQKRVAHATSWITSSPSKILSKSNVTKEVDTEEPWDPEDSVPHLPTSVTRRGKKGARVSTRTLHKKRLHRTREIEDKRSNSESTVRSQQIVHVQQGVGRTKRVHLRARGTRGSRTLSKNKPVTKCEAERELSERKLAENRESDNHKFALGALKEAVGESLKPRRSMSSSRAA